MILYKKLLYAQKLKRFYSYEFRDGIFLFFAEPLSILFFKLGLNANFVTFLSGLCSILGSLFLISKDPVIMFFAMFFFIAFYLLDYCDG